MQTIVALLLLTASPDAATSTTNSETPVAKPAKPKKICRPGAATGTRMTSKICKTQAEWDAQIGADASKIKGDRGAGY